MFLTNDVLTHRNSSEKFIGVIWGDGKRLVRRGNYFSIRSSIGIINLLIEILLCPVFHDLHSIIQVITVVIHASVKHRVYAPLLSMLGG